MTSDLCQFFTSDLCSESLVAAVAAIDPLCVIDVGAGHGSLTRAALRRWQGAQVTLMDVDPLALDVLQQKYPSASRVHVDLLRDKLPNPLGRWLDRADVVLCNPPFRTVEGHVADLWLKAAKMPIDWPDMVRCRAEMVFLAHNLRLLKNGGELAMILPAMFVNGHVFEPFRAWLLETLTVTKVIQLPSLAFANADVRAYAVIARKAAPPPGHRVQLLQYGDTQDLLTYRAIPTADGIKRLDPSFHVARSMHDGVPTLRDVDASITRGKAVHELKRLQVPYFHTTDFSGYEPGASAHFLHQDMNAKIPAARRGDILLGRVGRNCYLQVLGIARGQAYFSDCVYKIKVPKGAFRAVLKSLADPRSVQWRASRLRGSTVALLSKSDLLEHPLWWEYFS